MIVNIDELRARKDFQRRARRAYLGAFSADITDDGKTIQFHWDYNDCTNIELHSLLLAYLEKHGIKDTKK